MDAQHKYNVEEVLEIALTLAHKDMELRRLEIHKSLLNKGGILNHMSKYHEK